MNSPIGEFKYSSSFSFMRNGGSPPKQHYTGYGSPPRPSLQRTVEYDSGTSVSASPNDSGEGGTSPLGGFKYSSSFCFAKNGSPPKHYAYGSPPKPVFMHRRRSSTADQSSNWRVLQAPVVSDATEPNLADVSLNFNPLNAPDTGIHTLPCPKSISQLLYGSNGLPAGKKFLSSLGKAEQLIAFSYTDEHRQEFNNKSMRYFVEPPTGADLTSGFENWKADSEWRGGIGDLLRAVCHAKKGHEESETLRADKFVMPDLIAWRGNIIKYVSCMSLSDMWFFAHSSLFAQNLFSALRTTQDRFVGVECHVGERDHVSASPYV